MISNAPSIKGHGLSGVRFIEAKDKFATLPIRQISGEKVGSLRALAGGTASTVAAGLLS
jgi:hypothetical protein